MENQVNTEKEGKRHVHEFKKCLPLQIALHEMSKTIGSTDGLTCLDVGLNNGMMAYHLRKLGGTWHSAVRDEQTAAVLKEFVPKNVAVINDGALPFKKKVFDLVVVYDYLERVQQDEHFIEECHRILQADGRIVITVPNRKGWTIANPMRKILGRGAEDRGWVRPGYTESQLFGILKHGFDVQQVRSYGKLLIELTDTLVRSLLARASGSDNPEERCRRISSIAGPFYRIAYQLDMLLFIGKGFNLVATAKRRTWRPRNAPVLVDGRSISEAVLSRPGV